MAYILKEVVEDGKTIAIRDYGVHGEVYPIEEEDMHDYLRRQLNSVSIEELISIKERMRSGYTGFFTKLPPVKGIEKAQTRSVSYFDPTVTAQMNMTDHEGTIIVKKGTQYNPLDHVSLPENLLFFDGDDPQQLSWARKQEGRWIFVKGQPLEAEQQEVRPIYFDQFGFLCKKLKITQVPALVSQEDKKLKIETFVLEGSPCSQD